MQIDSAIVEDVRRLVAEILALEIDEVTPEALFFDDLGGESIELIELSFHLEKIYGVRVRFQDLGGDDYKLDDQGRLTPDALTALKSKFPFLNLEGFENRPLRRRTEFITIEALAGFVQLALAARSASTLQADKSVETTH
jgi:acyl carrier protein